MRVMKVQLGKIKLDPAYQPRFQLDPRRIADFRESFQEDDHVPPVWLGQKNDHYVVVEGFHRVVAAQKEGLNTIEAFMLPSDQEHFWLLDATRMNDKTTAPLTKEEVIAAIQRTWMAGIVKDPQVIASKLRRSPRFVQKVIKPLKDMEKKDRNFRIRSLAEQGYTQEEIGKKVGVCQATVSNLLKNEHPALFNNSDNNQYSNNLSNASNPDPVNNYSLAKMLSSDSGDSEAPVEGVEGGEQTQNNTTNVTPPGGQGQVGYTEHSRTEPFNPVLTSPPLNSEGLNRDESNADPSDPATSHHAPTPHHNSLNTGLVLLPEAADNPKLRPSTQGDTDSTQDRNRPHNQLDNLISDSQEDATPTEQAASGQSTSDAETEVDPPTAIPDILDITVDAISPDGVAVIRILELIDENWDMKRIIRYINDKHPNLNHPPTEVFVRGCAAIVIMLRWPDKVTKEWITGVASKLSVDENRVVLISGIMKMLPLLFSPNEHLTKWLTENRSGYQDQFIDIVRQDKLRQWHKAHPDPEKAPVKPYDDLPEDDLETFREHRIFLEKLLSEAEEGRFTRHNVAQRLMRQINVLQMAAGRITKILRNYI